MSSFFLSNWSPPDDPARPLPAEGRPWPSYDYDYGDDYDKKDDRNVDDDDDGEDIYGYLREACYSKCGHYWDYGHTSHTRGQKGRKPMEMTMLMMKIDIVMIIILFTLCLP